MSEIGEMTPFNRSVVRQLRALDSFGSLDRESDEAVLAPLILTSEQKRELPVIGDVDEVAIARIKAFYNAVALSVEGECGKMAVSFLNINHEGFGRALIVVGKLVVVDKTLREVHRWGVPSLAKLEARGAKMVQGAVALVEKFPEAADA